MSHAPPVTLADGNQLTTPVQLNLVELLNSIFTANDDDLERFNNAKISTFLENEEPKYLCDKIMPIKTPLPSNYKTVLDEDDLNDIKWSYLIK